MRTLKSLVLLFAAVSASAQTKYSNPVCDSDFPDPSVQRAQDGTFYAYATGPRTVKSADLVNWTWVNNVFDRPTWNDSTYVKNGEKKTDYYSLWASDVNLVAGRYVMYYASALWGNGSRTGIGVATGTSLTKFVDKGRMFRSWEIGVENSIDPCYIEEGDAKYLAWGSFNGIYITQLTDDGLAVKDPKNVVRIAGTAFEGAMIHKRGDYYYLFASTGSCCEGLRSTYQTVVGRATSLMGPYLSKSGQRMLDNNRTILIRANEHWVGPGHNSEILTDDEGQDWLLYHAYDATDPDKGRVMLLDRLKWDEQGWPYVEGGSPSHGEQDAPIFYKGAGQRVGYKFQNIDFMKSLFQGWTLTSKAGTEAVSGIGTVFHPAMRISGGDFLLEQSATGLTDGIYEMTVNTFDIAEKCGHVSAHVGAVVTPVPDRSQCDCGRPETDEQAGTFLASFPSRFYGLVVGGKLSIGFRGEGMEAGESFWAANVQLVRSDISEQAITALRGWYETRAAEVQESETGSSYYRKKLQSYTDDLAKALTPTEQYTALVNIHKTLNSLNALETIPTGIETPHAAAHAPHAYDLQGRPITNQKAHRGITIQQGCKHL